MKKNLIRLAGPMVFLLLIVTSVGFTNEVNKAPEGLADPAAGEEINWQVISAGGTHNAGSANFRLSGTAGQTAVGTGSSANFGVNHGFWQEFGGGGCCNHDGMRGDANYDLQGPNIVDLTFIVAYLFSSGEAPPCWEEGDCNGDGNVNIVDLTLLVGYLFGGGAPPEPCP